MGLIFLFHDFMHKLHFCLMRIFLYLTPNMLSPDVRAASACCMPFR